MMAPNTQTWVSRSAGAAAALLGLAVLGGCDSARATANCPGTAILADAASRPVLKPGAAPVDPSAMIYAVQVTNIEESCTLDVRRGITNSNVTLTFRGTRPPSGQPAHYVVPYFLVINQGARVINKRMFNIVIDFAPGASIVTAQTEIDGTELHLENGRLPQDYQFLAGFQLTEAELAYNKAVGPYTP